MIFAIQFLLNILAGKIIVTVLINKQPKRFVFDTGAQLLISNDLMASNNNPIVGSATVTDAGGKTIEQNIVKVPDLTLGNVPLKNGMAEGFEPKVINPHHLREI